MDHTLTNLHYKYFPISFSSLPSTSVFIIFRNSNVKILLFLFFLLAAIISDRLASTEWFYHACCILKFRKTFTSWFSVTHTGLCSYHNDFCRDCCTTNIIMVMGFIRLIHHHIHYIQLLHFLSIFLCLSLSVFGCIANGLLFWWLLVEAM